MQKKIIKKYNRLMKKSFLDLISNHLYSYPTPINISYLWSFGALAGICLVIQIVTGIFLAMQYTPNTAYAFVFLEKIGDISINWQELFLPVYEFLKYFNILILLIFFLTFIHIVIFLVSIFEIHNKIMLIRDIFFKILLEKLQVVFSNDFFIISILFFFIILNIFYYNSLLLNQYVLTKIFIKFILYLGSVLTIIFVFKKFSSIENDFKKIDLFIIFLISLNFSLRYNPSTHTLSIIFVLIYSFIVFLKYKNINIKNFYDQYKNFLYYTYSFLISSYIIFLILDDFNSVNMLIGMIRLQNKLGYVLIGAIGANSERIIDRSSEIFMKTLENDVALKQAKIAADLEINKRRLDLEILKNKPPSKPWF